MPKTLMQSVISELQKERERLQGELHRVATALTAFGNVYLHGSRPTRKRRTISVAGRKRIAAAQRARWAKIKGQKIVSISSRKGRTMSRLPAKGLSQPRKRAGRNGEHKRRPRLPINYTHDPVVSECRRYSNNSSELLPTPRLH